MFEWHLYTVIQTLRSAVEKWHAVWGPQLWLESCAVDSDHLSVELMDKQAEVHSSSSHWAHLTDCDSLQRRSVEQIASSYRELQKQEPKHYSLVIPEHLGRMQVHSQSTIDLLKYCLTRTQIAADDRKSLWSVAKLKNVSWEHPTLTSPWLASLENYHGKKRQYKLWVSTEEHLKIV